MKTKKQAAPPQLPVAKVVAEETGVLRAMASPHGDHLELDFNSTGRIVVWSRQRDWGKFRIGEHYLITIRTVPRLTKRQRAAARAARLKELASVK